MRIAIIEDERQLAQLLRTALENEGHSVTLSHDGETGLRAVLEGGPELVVLDLNLPRMGGMELLRELRMRDHRMRVIILTARDELESRLAGLRAGADDYMTKPFSIEELVARVEAVGRRAGKVTEGDLLDLEDLRLDTRQRLCTRGGRVIELSPREYELLELLMREPGRVFTRGELCERVWNKPHSYDTRTVDVFINRLRRKVDPEGAAPLIHTVRSSGYVVQAKPPAVGP